MRQGAITLSELSERIRTKLVFLYGPEQSPGIFDRLMKIVGAPRHETPNTALSLSERDVILITYADQVRHTGEAPLGTLGAFLRGTVGGTINTVHILPFYPYSSDDGFSVIDYYAVNPDFGAWDDIRRLGEDFRLMFDAVFNHVSSRSDWFQAFLRGEAPYDRYFIPVDPQTDLSMVRRPRALPLLTRFETAHGEQYVWTTFSADQIDLNAANPDVLLELIRALLFYVKQGADLIRLDAIAYLWKTVGTSCIHLPQTHLIIQLMRDVLDMIAPSVILITETNVPHDENLSYFGDGANEAQMVYQFSLPPLVLHTFRTGDTGALTHWAAGLQRISDRTTFFNFTASHDGIGVMPARGILSDDEIAALVTLAEEHGGYVSTRHNPDGSQSPYELNITYFDAITHPSITAQSPSTAWQRFICSQAIMLAFVGVPGIYFHSLFASRNDREGVQQTGRYRTINREKLDTDALEADLSNPDSLRHRVYTNYMRLLKIRTGEPVFHPLGDQTVLDLHPAVFALERQSPDRRDRVIALHNVRGEAAAVSVPAREATRWRDLVGGQEHAADGALHMTLTPYQVCWLKPVRD